MKKSKAVFIILISFLFFPEFMLPPYDFDAESLSLPDKFENDEVIINNIALGDRCYGENVFQADIQNKTEKIIYITLDLRSEAKDGFSGNWQSQFIYMLFPTRKKRVTANYELRLVNDESTIRITFSILEIENDEISQ
jgi:hypothetical protein